MSAVLNELKEPTSFRELEKTLELAWNNKNIDHDVLMGLQHAWEQQVDRLVDNPDEFNAEIAAWDTPYLEDWVKTIRSLYKEYGEEFNAKPLFAVAKQELLRRRGMTLVNTHKLTF